jgi:hypothetical protein
MRSYTPRSMPTPAAAAAFRLAKALAATVRQSRPTRNVSPTGSAYRREMLHRTFCSPLQRTAQSR